MSISHDRLIFALSVLEGKPDAHRILADTLEEEGDRGLADWARAKKGKRHKRIDFVLALLPHKLTLLLASDFLCESLTLLEANRKRGDRGSVGQPSLLPVIKAVQGIADWTQGSISIQLLEQHRNAISSVVPWSHGIQDIDTTMRSLRAALDYSESAETLAGSDPKTSSHHASESRNHSRKVAKAARELSRPLVVQSQWHAMRRGRTESRETDSLVDYVGWQIEHARTVITEQLKT